MTDVGAGSVRLGPLRFFIGFLGISIGVLMVVEPAQFTPSSSMLLQPDLCLWGWLAFLIGLSTVGVALFAPPIALGALVHIAAGTFLVFFDLGMAHSGSGAGFAHTHYLPLAAVVLVAPWLDRSRPLRFAARDSLGLTIGMTGVAAGIWLVAQPVRFVSSAYAPVHPWLFPIGIAFSVGGIALLALLLLDWRRLTGVEWGARILLGTAFWSFLFLVSWPHHLWTGVVYYGSMGTVAVLGPFLGRLVGRFDPTSIVPRLTFTVFAVALVSALVALTGALNVDRIGDLGGISGVPSEGDALVGVFLLLAALASFLGYLLARAITQPLVSLVRAVERPNRDGAPRPTLPRPNRPSEVRSLANALAMTFETLDSQKAEITAERDRLARILQQMPLGVVILEAPSGRLLFGNDQVAAIWRQPLFDASKVDEFATFKAFHPDGSLYSQEEWPLARSLHKGETVVGEQMVIERGDATRGVLAITAGPIYDSDGRIVAAVAAIEDVTERKLTGERLIRLQAMTTRLASAMTEAELGETIVSAAREQVGADNVIIYRVVPEDDVVEMSFPHCDVEDGIRLVGRIPLQSELPVSQAIRAGQVVSIPTPESVAHFPELYALFRNTGYYGAEVIPISSEGHTTGALVLVFRGAHFLTPADWAFLTALASHAGETSRRVQRLESERAARRATLDALRVRDEFLAIASHELRTPITSLIGFSQLVLNRLRREGQVEPARLERALSEVDRQAHRLTELVEQLLDVSRLQSGQTVLRSQPVDLRGVVAGAIVPFSQIHPARTFGVDAPMPVIVHADSLRLEQVLVNLIANAVKFSPAAEPIEVMVGWESDVMALIAVRDHGIGIPIEQREQIFDRFYQARRQDFQYGLGLGLFISRQIVTLHGGTISVEAPDDGGTRFVVRLPIRSEAQTETPNIDREPHHS